MDFFKGFWTTRWTKSDAGFRSESGSLDQNQSHEPLFEISTAAILCCGLVVFVVDYTVSSRVSKVDTYIPCQFVKNEGLPMLSSSSDLTQPLSSSSLVSVEEPAPAPAVTPAVTTTTPGTAETPAVAANMASSNASLASSTTSSSAAHAASAAAGVGGSSLLERIQAQRAREHHPQQQQPPQQQQQQQQFSENGTASTNSLRIPNYAIAQDAVGGPTNITSRNGSSNTSSMVWFKNWFGSSSNNSNSNSNRYLQVPGQDSSDALLTNFELAQDDNDEEFAVASSTRRANMTSATTAPPTTTTTATTTTTPYSMAVYFQTFILDMYNLFRSLPTWAQIIIVLLLLYLLWKVW